MKNEITLHPSKILIQLRKYRYLLQLSKMTEKDLDKHFKEIDSLISLLQEGDQVSHIFNKTVYTIIEINNVEDGIITLKNSLGDIKQDNIIHYQVYKKGRNS